MFESFRIKTEKHLQELLINSRESLLKSLHPIHYPSVLCTKDGISKWESNYKEIDKLNKDLLSQITNRAGVYLISTHEKRRRKILYIGQTQSKTSRQRIRSHIVWRNKKTNSGKFTGSQFDNIQEIVISGKTLRISFVEIIPSPLRHYIEEKLIEELNPPWNKHKTKKV